MQSAVRPLCNAEEIQSIKKRIIRVKRRVEKGVEVLEGPLPMVVTVNSSAASCRPRNAKLLMKYKYARIPNELQASNEDYTTLCNSRDFLQIGEWSVNDIVCDPAELGLSGSPTKVKKIENVIFQAKESKSFTTSDEDIEGLIQELISNHTIG